MTASSAYDEKALLSAIANGSEPAFRQLFLHWHQQLAGYIYRITESKEHTEEIVQDVFLKIWMVRETLTGIRNFKSFLLVVSRNRAYDVLKQQSRERWKRKAWETESAIQHFCEPPEMELIQLSLIDKAIASLPPRRKEVFLLCRYEGFAYNEAAEQLGISRESVKTHLRLATASISTFIRSNASAIFLSLTILSKIL